VKISANGKEEAMHLDLFTYPKRTGYKEKGGTSQLAADKIEKSGKATRLRTKTLDLYTDLYPRALTADETASLLGEEIWSIRPRVTELFKDGHLTKTKERRPSANGGKAVAYRLNAAGSVNGASDE
jgi:hypothetical protein